MATPKTILKDEATVRISIEEFEYLMQCQKELRDIKNLIGEILGGK